MQSSRRPNQWTLVLMSFTRDAHTLAAVLHSAVDPSDNDDPPFFQEEACLFSISGGTDRIWL
jgi:hypothetical protein